MVSQKEKKVDDTLDLANKVAIELFPAAPRDLPLPDLTMKQFRTAMLLFIAGNMRMNCIAQMLGVSMATANGIVNRLVEQDIVKREHDLEDRRVVVCRLSSHGREILSQTWQSFRENTKRILMAIPEGSINLVNETLMLFLETGKNLNKDIDKECVK
jgi:DNA-binding MarR family transcriptional regulator